MHGHRSAANFLLTPLRYMKWFVQWMVGRASWLMLQTQIAHLINPDWAWSMEQEQADYHYEDNDGSPGKRTNSTLIRSFFFFQGLIKTRIEFYFKMNHFRTDSNGRRIHG